MVRRTHVWRIVLAGVVVALALAACGSSGSSSSTSTAPATVPVVAPTTDAAPVTDGTTVNATVGETDVAHQYMTVDPSEVPAGSVTFNIVNEGVKKHEFVILSTDTPAADLKLSGDEADESAYDAVDEAEDIEGGATAILTVDLKAGHYAIICNLKGHYGMGMYTDLEVK